MSAGALVLWAALLYLDGEGLALQCLLACALHELGHLLAIYALGGEVACFRVTCVGAELRLSARTRLGPAAQFLAALAGPLVNLGTGFAALALAGKGGWCFAGLSFALAAFNLLPAAPLDGGRALWCALALLAGRVWAERLLPPLSAALGAGLTAGALLLLCQGRGNVTLLLTALWLLAAPAAGRLKKVPAP